MRRQKFQQFHRLFDVIHVQVQVKRVALTGFVCSGTARIMGLHVTDDEDLVARCLGAVLGLGDGAGHLGKEASGLECRGASAHSGDGAEGREGCENHVD